MKDKASPIPVVDISKIGLLVKDKELSKGDFKDIASELRSAFLGCGFVYLRGHGFPMELMEEVMAESKRFFEGHSLEEKKKAFPYDRKTMVGYNGPNVENFKALAEDDHEKRATYEMCESLETTRVTEDARFPDQLAPKMRPLFVNLRGHLQPLALRILRAISISLGLDQDHFGRMHRHLLEEGNRSDFRTIYYPAIKGDVTPGLTRCGEHFDYGMLTLLFQDPLGGLEVKDVGDGWIRAPPIEDCILMNLGEEMEIFTNGVYPATRHRVVVPEAEVMRRRPRQSFAFFVKTDEDVVLKPLFNEEPKSQRYRPITSREHQDKLLKTTYK